MRGWRSVCDGALSSAHVVWPEALTALEDGRDRSTGLTHRAQTATAAGTPFVGRDAELDQLLRALGETAQRRGCVALIGGEPGIGKSRLADQLAIRARDDGMRTL